MRHTRACCENFCGFSAGEMASKFPELFDGFWPTTQWLCLLQFCFSIFAVGCSSLSEDIVEFSYAPLVSLSKLFFTKAPHYSTLSFTYVEYWQLFHYTIYVDIAALQGFKVSLLLSQSCQDFARIYRDRKVQKIFTNLSSTWIVSSMFIKAH